jgi:putative chitobiose transport system permease protein
MKMSRKALALFLLPGGILFALFALYPLLGALKLAFFNYNVFSAPVFCGAGNFAEMAHNASFWNAARNSFIYLIVTPLLASTSLVVAVLVNRKMRGINFFRTAYFLPVVVPMVIAGITWKFVLDDGGVLNNLLMSMHVIKSPVFWLTGADFAIWSVMFVTFWKGIGYYMVMFLTGLQNIPSNLYEAAEVDGASEFYAFRRITLPLLKPYLLLVLILSSTAAIKVFDEVYVLTSGGPLRRSETLIFYMYANALNNFPPRIGFACAVGVVIFFIAAMIALLNKYVVRAQ